MNRQAFSGMFVENGEYSELPAPLGTSFQEVIRPDLVRMSGATQRCKARLKNRNIYWYVREKLILGWSPEQIAGRLPIDHPGESIHHETIYRYIYNDPHARWEKLWQYLPCHRYRRWDRHEVRGVRGHKIVGIIRIDKRPEEVETRLQPGHWETDMMIERVSDRKMISALVERKTRVTHLSLLLDKSAQAKAESVVECLGIYPKRIRKTVTTDNGSENSNHRFVTKALGAPVYFCNPY